MTKSYRFYFTLLFFSVFLLIPFLKTGYYFDDSLNSAFWNNRDRTLSELCGALMRFIKAWTFQERRLFPLAPVITYSSFYFTKELFFYRIYQIGLVLLNLVGFYYFLRLLLLRRWFIGLFILILLSCFQLRNFHDPITGYAGLLQFSLGFGLGSLIYFRKYIQQPRVSFAVFSSIFLILAYLTYEVNIVFIFIIILIQYENRNARDKSLDTDLVSNDLATNSFYINGKFLLKTHLIITFAYFAITLYLRTSQAPVYSGTTIHLGLRTLSTYLFQATAALPLIYPIFGRSDFVNLHSLIHEPFLSWQTLFIFIFLLVAFFQFINHSLEKSISTFKYKLLLKIALILILIPPLVVSISLKYQNEITRPGHAYLPVYISYFGIALIFALWMNKYVKSKFGVVAHAVAWALICTLNFTVNSVTADSMNQFWKYSRELLDEAAQKQLFTSICEDETVFNDTGYYWLSTDLMRSYCHSSIQIRTFGLISKEKTDPTNHTYLKFTAIGSNQGWIFYTKMKVQPNSRVGSEGASTLLIKTSDTQEVSHISIQFDNQTISLKSLSPFKTQKQWSTYLIPELIFDLSTLEVKQF